MNITKLFLGGYDSGESGVRPGMDPLVVVDAIAECMAYEEKELCKIGNIAILIMFKVAGMRIHFSLIERSSSNSSGKPKR